jgi:ribosome-associated translation inhibitor RaiA
MDYNELLNFHHKTEEEITKDFSKELNRRMDKMINDPYKDDNSDIVVKILELPQEHRIIFSDIVTRNIELEEKLLEAQKDLNIAYKYFELYSSNLEKELEKY